MKYHQITTLFQKESTNLNQPQTSSQKLSSKLTWIPKVSFKKRSTKYQKPTNNVYQSTTEDISSPPTNVDDTVEYKNLQENRNNTHTAATQQKSNSDIKPRLPTVVKTPSGAAEVS